jgi:hypothetical protein
VVFSRYLCFINDSTLSSSVVEHGLEIRLGQTRKL